MNPHVLFTRLRGRARTGILVEGSAIFLTVFVAYMLVSFTLDRSLRLEEVYRVSMLIAFVVCVWHFVKKHMLTPMSVDLTDEELALAFERGEIGLEQALISAVQFERVMASGQPTRESHAMMQSVVSDVHGRVASLRDGVALDTNRVVRFGAVIFGCLAVVATWAVLDAQSLGLWAKRNLLMSSDPWPRATSLRFLIEQRPIAEGSDLSVEIEATGVIPEQVFVHYAFADGTKGSEPMALMGGEQEGAGRRFTWLLEALMFDVELYATGGDGLSEVIDIQLVKRPVIEDLKVTRTYPAYMQRPPEDVAASEGDIRIPAGTTLNLAGAASTSLENAYLTFGKDQRQELALAAGSKSFTGTLLPKESGVLTIDVTDANGLGSAKPPKLFLRVVADRAPSVDFKTLGIGSMILYKALIPGNLKLRDDFGLTKVASYLRITDGEKGPKQDAKWEKVDFEGLRQPDTKEGETDYLEKVVFDLLTRNSPQPLPSNPIQPGMLLSLKFEAADNFGPGEAHLGTSEVLTLRVVSEEKLMQDLHRRQAERRRELMRILDKEKEAKAELDEILSPVADDPRAKRALYKLQALAREQRALQKQVMHIAEAYRQILDEYFNNRVLKPAQIQQQRQGIQMPLENLAKENFPNSASEVDDFSRIGTEDLRSIAVASYGEIIDGLERVIANMRHLESVAGILEELGRIRDDQVQVEKMSRKLLDALDKPNKDAKPPTRPPDDKPPKKGG